MSWRAFWIVLGAVVTALGFLPAAYEAQVWHVALGAAILAVLAAAATAKLVGNSPGLVETYSYTERALITRWVWIGIVAHYGWVMLVATQPGAWWLWLAGLCALAGIEYAASGLFVFWVERVKPARERAAAQRQQVVEQRQQHQPTDRVLMVIQAAVSSAQLSWMHLDPRWVALPNQSGIQFRLRVPPRDEAMTKGQKSAAKDGLPQGESAEALAIAFQQHLQVDVASDWVQVRKDAGAGAYTVTVLVRDAIAEVIPYVDPVGPDGRPTVTSIREEALVGWQVSGAERRMLLAGHSQDVGKTGSGKSSLTNVKLAHRTRCTDVVQFVCGTEKVYDLVGPWLEPYEGTDHAPPIAWAVAGAEDTAEMLAAAMRIARYRQSCRMSERGNWPAVVVTLTEASFALQNPNARAFYDGAAYHASALAAMIMRGAFSADVFLEVDSQRSTQDQWGDKGGDIATNMTSSTIFRSKDQQEVGRVTGDYQLKIPKHKGEYWLVTDGESPEKIKAPYIQQDDPSKPRLHDGSTLSQIAYSRRLLPEVQLDSGSAQAAGESFRSRHTRVTPEYIEYLRNGTDPGESGAVASVADTQRAEAAELLDALLPPMLDPAEQRAEVTAGTEEAAGSESVEGIQDDPIVQADAEAPATDHAESVAHTGEDTSSGVPSPFLLATSPAAPTTRSWAERIEQAVIDAGEPVGPSEIRAVLDEQGTPIEGPVLTSTLKRMVNRGRLVKQSRGRYTTPGAATGSEPSKQTNTHGPVGVSRARA